jgi:hypothetical protein
VLSGKPSKTHEKTKQTQKTNPGGTYKPQDLFPGSSQKPKKPKKSKVLSGKPSKTQEKTKKTKKTNPGGTYKPQHWSWSPGKSIVQSQRPGKPILWFVSSSRIGFFGFFGFLMGF